MPLQTSSLDRTSCLYSAKYTAPSVSAGYDIRYRGEALGGWRPASNVSGDCPCHGVHRIRISLHISPFILLSCYPAPCPAILFSGLLVARFWPRQLGTCWTLQSALQSCKGAPLCRVSGCFDKKRRVKLSASPPAHKPRSPEATSAHLWLRGPVPQRRHALCLEA